MNSPRYTAALREQGYRIHPVLFRSAVTISDE
jgi:hypothetical protein